MTALTLTLRERPAQRVDLSALTIDRLTGLTVAQIGALVLPSGNRTIKAADLFSISGEPGDTLEIRNSCDQLDRIGQGMTGGSIAIRGGAGAYLGAGLDGGRITVDGDAGAYAATGMRSGLIHVRGNVGDFVASAVAGEHRGMQGGAVVVSGTAGDRAGDRMRRGMLLIEGNAGDYCASRMVAGTLAVWGSVGKSPGLAMRRGTLLLQQAPATLLPTFNDCGEFPLAFLTLLARSWRALPGRYATLPDTGLRVRRYMGDLGNDGRGEILIRS
jgi:formylmethanofuran dehydrogenase subunit C